MNYLIRNIPLALWIRFKVRAAQEHVPMRTLILSLLTRYLDRQDAYEAPPTAQDAHVPAYARGEHPHDR